MKTLQHLDRTDVTSRIIDDSLRAILDQVLQQRQRLVDLPPFPCFFLKEPRPDRRHDLVELLEIVSTRGDFLHERRRRSPGIVVGRLSDLGFHLGNVQDHVFRLSVVGLQVVHGQVLRLARQF